MIKDHGMIPIAVVKAFSNTHEYVAGSDIV